MEIQYVFRAPHAADLRELTQQRLRAALSRLSAQVPAARVSLSDLNGPRGGVDKRCHLALRTSHAGTVIVSSVASTWRDAFEDALDRAMHLLRRTLQQRRQQRGARPQAGDNAI